MLRLLALLSLQAASLVQPPALRRLLQLRAALCLHLPCALQQPTLLLLILHRWATGFLVLQCMHFMCWVLQGQLGQLGQGQLGQGPAGSNKEWHAAGSREQFVRRLIAEPPAAVP